MEPAQNEHGPLPSIAPSTKKQNHLRKDYTKSASQTKSLQSRYFDYVSHVSRMIPSGQCLGNAQQTTERNIDSTSCCADAKSAKSNA
jgi:phosphoribosyl-AMP cyclohydrolase